MALPRSKHSTRDVLDVTFEGNKDVSILTSPAFDLSIPHSSPPTNNRQTSANTEHIGKEKSISACQTISHRRNKCRDFQASFSLRSHKANTFTGCFTHSLRSFSQVFNTELRFLSWRFHTFFCLQFFQSLLLAPDCFVQLAATGKSNSRGT